MMMFSRSVCLLLLLVTACKILLVTEASKVRGQQRPEGSNSQEGHNDYVNQFDGRIRGEVSDNNRKLFADKWVSLDGQQRGGAGAAAKNSVEFVPMRTLVPSPLTTSAPVQMTPSPVTPAPVVPATPNPTRQPTMAPVPVTPAPVPVTPAPIPITAVPSNDRCTDAVLINVTAEGLGLKRAIVYSGSTIGARLPIVSPSVCNTLTNTAPGVWYKVQGTGFRMWASTCWPGTNYDTKITVYSGNCGSNMRCETANDDAGGTFGPCTGNLRASRAGWASQRGVTYYILVHGFYSKTGDFDLNVITYAPLNNLCADAEDINVGDTVVGTTFQADVPFNGNFNSGISVSCSQGTFLVGAGVWYRIVGTGATITADTCNPLTDFNTKLNIFQGSCSSRNTCIAVNDDSHAPDRCSTIAWQSTAGTVYYILVNGFLTANGLFQLSVY